MSMTCGFAVPKMLERLSSRPGVPAGTPAAIAAARVLSAPTSMLSRAKTVLTECAVAVCRSMLPNCSSAKLWISPSLPVPNSGKVCGL